MDEDQIRNLEEKVSTDARYIDDLVKDVEKLKRENLEFRAMINDLAKALSHTREAYMVYPQPPENVKKAISEMSTLIAKVYTQSQAR